MLSITSEPRGTDGASGPYRTAKSLLRDTGEVTCPYCAGLSSPMLRVCPHCDVRFDNSRCARCYTLQPPGSFACSRCGQALELEPLLDPTDAPCPRCSTPLEAALGAAWDDARLHECPRCGGIFVPRDELAEILCRAERSGPIAEARRTRVVALEQVKYLPCPLCHTPMNRVNFGKSSGVIVDVCGAHGTWFDGGELTRAVTFAGAGGLARARAREREETSKPARTLVQATPSRLGGWSEMDDRLEQWRLFLRELFFW